MAERKQEQVVLHIEQLADDPAHDGEVIAARPPRRGRRATVAVSVVGLVLVGGLLADRAQQRQEIDALVADLDSTVTAVRRADTRATLIQIYLRPVSAPERPVGVPSAELEVIVREAEEAGADELADQGRRLGDATVLPWHTDLVEARDVLRQFVDGQEDRLRRQDDDPVPTVQDVADAARAVVPDGEQSERLEAVLGGVSSVTAP